MAYPQNKGKNYEREIAEKINAFFKKLCGAKFRRTPSPERWKWTTRGDINCEKKFICGDNCILSEFHWEITDRKSLSLLPKWEKTKDDAEYQKPVLVWKKTGKGEGVILKLNDFLSLLWEVQEARVNKGQNK